MTTLKIVASLTIAAAFWSAAPLHSADPNFSGAWKLNLEKSVISALAVPPDGSVVVEHEAAAIRWRPVLEDGKTASPLIYSTDGKERKNQQGSTLMKSILKWEGDALLVNTIVSGPSGNHTQMDRWRLSRDGKTLRVRRQVVRRQGEAEATLVYEKQ